MLEKSSSKVGVRTMREEIAILAGPKGWGDTRERWLERAADKLDNVSYRMVRGFFYDEITDDNHWAAIEIRRAVARIEAQREAADLAAQLETIMGRLNVTDPNFHQPTIEALAGTLRKLRGESSA
jgi:hypothetical protein